MHYLLRPFKPRQCAVAEGMHRSQRDRLATEASNDRATDFSPLAIWNANHGDFADILGEVEESVDRQTWKVASMHEGAEDPAQGAGAGSTSAWSARTASWFFASQTTRISMALMAACFARRVSCSSRSAGLTARSRLEGAWA